MCWREEHDPRQDWFSEKYFYMKEAVYRTFCACKEKHMGSTKRGRSSEQCTSLGMFSFSLNTMG